MLCMFLFPHPKTGTVNIYTVCSLHQEGGHTYTASQESLKKDLQEKECHLTKPKFTSNRLRPVNETRLHPPSKYFFHRLLRFTNLNSGMQHRICVAQFICGKMQTGPINISELQTVSWQSRQKTSTDDGLKKMITLSVKVFFDWDLTVTRNASQASQAFYFLLVVSKEQCTWDSERLLHVTPSNHFKSKLFAVQYAFPAAFHKKNIVFTCLSKVCAV
jgi:hypothetical protein